MNRGESSRRGPPLGLPPKNPAHMRGGAEGGAVSCWDNPQLPGLVRTPMPAAPMKPRGSHREWLSPNEPRVLFLDRSPTAGVDVRVAPGRCGRRVSAAEGRRRHDHPHHPLQSTECRAIADRVGVNSQGRDPCWSRKKARLDGADGAQDPPVIELVEPIAAIPESPRATASNTRADDARLQLWGDTPGRAHRYQGAASQRHAAALGVQSSPDLSTRAIPPSRRSFVSLVREERVHELSRNRRHLPVSKMSRTLSPPSGNHRLAGCLDRALPRGLRHPRSAAGSRRGRGRATAPS